MSLSLQAHTEDKVEKTEELMSLAVPLEVRLKVSFDDFETLCRENPDARLERNAQGELIVMSPVGSRGGMLEMFVAAPLFNWAEKKASGYCFGPSTGLRFPNGAGRSPDAAWIRRERWDALTDEDQERWAPIVPDFVAELRSRTDSRRDLHLKMLEYIEQGVLLGWLIDPKTKEVEIHRPGRPFETLIDPKTLSGEDVLPGFLLDLAPLFKDRDTEARGSLHG